MAGTALLLCCATAEAADTAASGTEVPPQRKADPRTVLFGSAEIGPSAYVNSGFKRALGPSLYEEGFLLMGTLGGGQRRERLPIAGQRLSVDHLSTEGSLLAGYQWRLERGVAAVFAGPEFDYRQPLVNGLILAAEDPRFGLRGLGEIWTHPTADTLLVGTLVLGTAPPRLWARGAYGWRVLGDVFVGPEAMLSWEDRYWETRLGLHATGLKIGRWSFGVSGGLLLTGGNDAQGYGKITTVWTP